MAQQGILALDLGTTNLKAGVVTADGTVAAATVRPVQTQIADDGAPIQDPAEIAALALDASTEVVKSAAASAEIVGVVCSSQFFSLIPVDSGGNPVGPMQPWMAQRGAAHSQQWLSECPDAFLKLLEIHGAIPFGSDSLSHALHLREDCPDTWDQAAALLEPADFLTTVFTGEIATNLCTAFAFLLTDNRDLANGGWSEELLSLAGIPRAKLAPMTAVDAQVGTVRSQVALELGLPANTPVFAPLNDTQAVTVGSGACQPGRLGLNIGTTIQVLGAAPSKKTDIESQTVSMPSPLAGEYLAMAECGLGGRVVEHFVRSQVYAEDGFGNHGTADVFDRLEEVVAGEPAGSGGLLFLPWLGGAFAPVENPEARGGFLGMTLGTTRARMARSVLEGVAFQLRWMFPFVESFTERPASEVTFSGGGARSRTWAAILASVLGRPLQQLADPGFANLRGAGFLGLHRLGILGRDALEGFCPIAETHEPVAKEHGLYEDLFGVWQLAFEANRQVFTALREVQEKN